MKFIINPLHAITGESIKCWIGNRKVNNKLKKSCVDGSCKDLEGSLLGLEQLLRYLQQEHERRRVVEDKAKTNVLGITLAFSVILASAALAFGNIEDIKKSLDWAFWIFITIQFAGIVFLLLGGMFALSALRISTVYTWNLEDEMSMATAQEKNAAIRYYVQQNQLGLLLKTNYLSASYCCIRNGVITSAAAAILAQIYSLL